ncbi:hypothetical protein [Nostoc sp.]
MVQNKLRSHLAPDCTFQTPGHFFSYRREKKVKWSGIVSFA